MRRNGSIAALLALVALVLGCDGGGGEVGIPFQNGTACLGENAQAIPGGDVYISVDGDDRNPGNREDAPLRTLAHALCNVRPGQTVHVLPGVYHESVILGAFGSSDAPIVIRGVPVGGELPILDGEGERSMGLALVECTNVVIENVTFRHYADEGLYVLLGSDITIRDNRFLSNGRASTDPDSDGEGFGVRVEGAANVLIERNEATENGPSADRVRRGILGTGIDTYALREAIIRDNHSHHNVGGGILVEDGVNVRVEGNQVYGNELYAGGDYWDGAIWVDGGRDVNLRGNTVVDNHGPGIQISDEDVQYPDASFGYVVQENTIAGNRFGVYLWNFGACPFPSAQIVRFVDNTVEGNTVQEFWCEEWPCGAQKPCD
jgi:parallel beta-helix repeat protein